MTLSVIPGGRLVPGLVTPRTRPVRSHVTLRATDRAVYDQERDIDAITASTALAAITAMHRSRELSALVAEARTHNPRIAHLLDGLMEASRTLQAAAAGGRVRVLRDTERVVDTMHPSMADDTDPTPPRGTPRGA